MFKHKVFSVNKKFTVIEERKDYTWSTETQIRFQVPARIITAHSCAHTDILYKDRLQWFKTSIWPCRLASIPTIGIISTLDGLPLQNFLSRSWTNCPVG